MAIDARSRRQGRALYEVGYYDPMKACTRLDLERIRILLAQGAQPSDTVRNLLDQAGLFKEGERA